MAVSSHRNYVSSTADDLERAAGLLEIRAKQEPDTVTAAKMRGASAALYAIAWHEIKDERDFYTIWARIAFKNDREEDGNGEG